MIQVSVTELHFKIMWSKSIPHLPGANELMLSNNLLLTHWGQVTHICVSKLTIIGSDNGLSPGQRQAIIWTNDGILLIGALGTNFGEILIEIQTFSFWKNRLKVSSAKWRPFCLGLNEIISFHVTVFYSSINNTTGILHIEARKNGWHFADNILTHVFFNENNLILIWSSLKFVPWQ